MMVRYCMAGHEVVYSGMCPSVCRICGQRINLSMPPITLEEAEAAKAAKAARTAQISESSKPSTKTAVSTTGQLRESENALPRPPVRQPMTPAARQPIMPAGRTPVSAGSRQPIMPSGTMPTRQTGVSSTMPTQQTAVSESTTAGVLTLSYFGMPIHIPPEGGWLGREALGGDFFEGNRLISRRHVFVRPDHNGRLMVQDDHSLNGVFYHIGADRQKLEKSATVLLTPGDTLWLYNIPLVLEVTDHVQ